jgi:hypothetical protein
MPEEIPDELLREEVAELTALLRDEEAGGFADLRTALAAKGLDPERVLLCSFGEDDDEHEFGLILTSGAVFFEYERLTAREAPLVFTAWRARNADASLRHDYVTIDAALTILAGM